LQHRFLGELVRRPTARLQVPSRRQGVDERLQGASDPLMEPVERGEDNGPSDAPKERSMTDMADSSRGFLRMDALWHTQLDCVACVGEVVAMVRDYLARITPEELARLPEACRALRVKAEDDIEYWTWQLSEAHGASRNGEGDPELVHEVFTHFLHASLRIAQIHRERARAALLTQ
jgi:hypothetical protein